MSDETASSSSQSPAAKKKKKKKESLGWMDWMRGWSSVFGEILFQRITASHLLNPLSLPPLNHLTCLVTGSSSGIGRQTARFFSKCDFDSVLDWWIIFRWCLCFFFFFLVGRQLAEGGAHVVMAVRNTKAARELIQLWQNEWSGKGLPLNIEVHSLSSSILYYMAK